MNGASAALQSAGVLILALVIVGFIGAYALIYPSTQGGMMALGALLPIAGGVGTYFFHTASQGFLGSQLAAQRAGFVAAITSTPSSSTPTWSASPAPLAPTISQVPQP